MSLEIIPITIRAANEFVEMYHRHNKKVQGARFAVGCLSNPVNTFRDTHNPVNTFRDTHNPVNTFRDTLVAVAIVGRPVARKLDNGLTAEITRLCAKPEAPKNACSFLYGRCWRIWQQMGGTRMITYTFRKEAGGSIRATGWRMIGATRGFGDHLKGWQTRANREKQENVKEPKFRWEIAKK